MCVCQNSTEFGGLWQIGYLVWVSVLKCFLLLSWFFHVFASFARVLVIGNGN
ncbi:hypothetical protein BDZ91DRAFT_729449 [Kalaharituber pfeilii]|nr:hypothetical protein BDZ91DRAFT_729449 [Kalaharituber pfeilii]